MVEGMLVDPTGTLKIILWQEFAHQLNEGDTYIFNNVWVKKDRLTKEIYVDAAKSGTTITLTDCFQEFLPITPEISHNNSCNATTVVGQRLKLQTG